MIQDQIHFQCELLNINMNMNTFLVQLRKFLFVIYIEFVFMQLHDLRWHYSDMYHKLYNLSRVVPCVDCKCSDLHNLVIKAKPLSTIKKHYCAR